MKKLLIIIFFLICSNSIALEKNANFIVSTHVKHKGKIKLDRPSTKFEKKGLHKGHSIWDWVLTKIS